MKKRRNQDIRFVVCITNSEPDLEPRKIYQVLPDEKADRAKYVRIIDESGEDYLYPEHYFMAIDLSEAIEKALLLAS